MWIKKQNKTKPGHSVYSGSLILACPFPWNRLNLDSSVFASLQSPVFILYSKCIYLNSFPEKSFLWWVIPVRPGFDKCVRRSAWLDFGVSHKCGCLIALTTIRVTFFAWSRPVVVPFWDREAYFPQTQDAPSKCLFKKLAIHFIR